MSQNIFSDIISSPSFFFFQNSDLLQHESKVFLSIKLEVDPSENWLLIFLNKKDFNTFWIWWTQTSQDFSASIENKIHKWNSKFKTEKKKEKWQNYQQMMNCVTGSSKLQCVNCQMFFAHPYLLLFKNNGTVFLKNHFKTCFKKKKRWWWHSQNHQMCKWFFVIIFNENADD